MEFNKQFNVHTLEELISSIIEFADGDMVWFRGHENSEYSLLPTLYRNKTVDFIDKKKELQQYSLCRRHENATVLCKKLSFYKR